MKQKLIILFLAGLILRLILSVINYSGDVSSYIAWGKDIVSYGTSGFYEREFMVRYGQATPNYPPIAMLSFALMYFLYTLVWPIIWNIKLHFHLIPAAFIWFWEEQRIMLPAFMKIPSIIADLGIAYFIYLFAKKLIRSKKSLLPLWATGFILFNPAFIYNSSYWGQIDSLPFPFLLGSFYLLMFTNRFILSAIMISLAILSKQTVIIFIPLYSFLFIHKYGLLKSIKSMLASFMTIILFLLPFYQRGNFITFISNTFFNKILFTFGSEYLTAHAFNFWGLTTGLGHIRDLTFLFLGVSVRWWSLGFVGLITIIIIYLIYKRKFKTQDIIWAGFLIPFTAFLFSTRMHERHLEMTLPFLLLAGINNRVVLKIFIFVSLFHFLNLYSGWWSPHFEILIKIFSPAIVVDFLITLVICLYFYLFIKYLIHAKAIIKK